MTKLDANFKSIFQSTETTVKFKDILLGSRILDGGYSSMLNRHAWNVAQ